MAGGLAERLRSGLQIREDRFDSGTRLHSSADEANGFPSTFPTFQVRPFALSDRFARLRTKEC